MRGANQVSRGANQVSRVVNEVSRVERTIACGTGRRVLNGGMPSPSASDSRASRPAPMSDPLRCAALRDDLRRAGYTGASLRAAWGDVADEAIGRGLASPALTALAQRHDALAVLARVLFLGRSAPAADVDAALPRCGAGGLVALGLASRDRDTVVPRAIVRPQSLADEHGEVEWWIGSDLDEVARHTAGEAGPLPPDHVLGVGGASLTLAGLQLTSATGRVLDVGTGCGIQALRASRVAGGVVATDVSERALAFTALNAVLNDVPGITTRAGSLFEPVAGELFDRVVSNPPFVITPRGGAVPAYEYRDGGMAGDALVATFVSQVGTLLAPGGVAQLLGNWEYRDDEDGLERVRSWVAASPVPLDAWVVERERLDVLGYAELWVRDGATVPGTAEYERLVEAWLADFADRGVTSIGLGTVLLRRAVDGPGTGSPERPDRQDRRNRLDRYERITSPSTGALGAHLTSALEAWDRLADMDDAALARARPVVAPDVTEARHFRPGAEGPSVIELRQGGGYARVESVDPATAALVGACDGDLTLGVLIDAIAELMDADPAALRTDLLPRVRDLIFTGMLTLP